MSEADENGAAFNAGVLADYIVETDMELRYTRVSEGFCKILGYDRRELLGKRVAEITAPQTNNISVIFELFLRNSYMHGIWVFVNHSGNTKIFVRYEARLRSNLIECTMELIGGGA
jgi:PAS domain S-box-containing protein